MKNNNKIQIFNLEFPPYLEELKIGDYSFKRIENYEKAFNGMMHLVNSSGSEFNTQIKVGSHQITAIGEIPQKEKKCVLPFENSNLTQVDDILFLLTLFTNRNVFKKDWEDSENVAIISDHRIHQYGGQLVCSIQHESMWKNKNTGELKTESEMKDISFLDYYLIDIGFEKTINKVFSLISSERWQSEYKGGYFLFLFRSAIQRQIIEIAFISCWIIWEHIFAIKNTKLSYKEIEKTSGGEKITFILNEYFLKNIDNNIAKTNITRINKTRNRFIHFGKKTDQISYKEMEMFIRLTEQLIAIILELSPSNIFNSFQDLDAFLTKETKN